MADVELLPLPEIERWRVTGDYAYPTEVDPEGGAVDYDAHVAAMQTYACANVAHATAPLQAEVEALRAEVDALREVLGRILENEASDYKAAEEFGGYVLDDELREEARAVLRREGWK